MILRPIFAVFVVAVLSMLIACSDASIPESSTGSDAIAPPNGAAPGNTAPGGGSNAGSDNPDNPKQGTPAPVTCSPGSKSGAAGFEEIEMQSNGIDRQASIYVPKTHDGTKALPVVLVIHPLLLTYKDMRKLANVEALAEDAEHGFIAVYPNGISRSWNAGECCGKAKDQKLDDVGFIRDLLAHVEAKWCVDKSRLYSMGFSNGAFLSHRLACELGGDWNLRAIVPVAGTLGIPESDCKPAHKTAVLAMHGTEDELVPYAGGPPNIPRGTSFGTFASPAATDAFWATQNGCGANATTPYYSKGEASCVRHEGCKNDATVALCTVTGGGHQWPGGNSLPAMGHVTTDLDATAAAIEMFRAHAL